ncbi:MAG: ABC transporter ATP-binding protein [Verrucomicrobia bacterium]|nr:ABC transporter ATP-binding protein [Verrucomicrobiota bacterium]
MSNAVITVENISKRYILGHKRSKDDGFRHLVEDAVRAPLRWLRNRREERAASSEEYWALKDVSFEVKQGEVVGIVGRNGAGKSTLLKILSRITEPTSGRITIEGRVASLLEVGTGFHPELTGRENIFLNGAILGMSRVEIRRKFDEIVAFSEVEQFLDTPVNRYSSGMYVRLAFAVAAHLEPEILIVDEVLAVGDAQFQKKCMGKMGEISKQEGRTVLFVSHNMGAVSNICTAGLLLHKGQKLYSGTASHTVEAYLSSGATTTGEVSWTGAERPGTDRVKINSVKVIGDGEAKATVSIDRPISFEVDFEVFVGGLDLSVSLHVVHPSAGEVLSTANFPSALLGHDEWAGRTFPAGRYRSVCTLPPNFLNEGIFLLNVAVMKSVRDTEVFVREAIQFTAQETGGMRKEYTGHWIGVVRPRLEWATAKV